MLARTRKKQKAMPPDPYQAVREDIDRLKVAVVPVGPRIKDGLLRVIGIGKGWPVASADRNEFLRQHPTVPRRQGGGRDGPDAGRIA
jgi:hypothetical protein